MTSVTIVSVPIDDGELVYRAVCGDHRSSGRTAGEALDALTAQLDSDEKGTLVIVQDRRPDSSFSAEQQARLKQLMIIWRRARDGSGSISEEQQRELESLIDAELTAAGQR